jgi:thymidylate kinase/ribosomal protein L40E
MGVVIFEGADLVGKSTLAKRVASMLSIPYYKGQGPSNVRISMKDTARLEIMQMVDLLKQCNFDICCDRNYLSEYVYGKVFKREIDKDFLLKYAHKEFQKLGAVVVIVDAADSTLESRYRERGDDKVIFDEILVLRDEYRKIVKELKSPNMILVDNSGRDPNAVALQIANIVREMWSNDFDVARDFDVSLCKKCGCMTHTITTTICSKCKNEKLRGGARDEDRDL